MKITRRATLRTLALAAGHTATRRLALAADGPPDAPLHDPLRPSVHYLPARNWMNDPCAPLFHNGQYHMFHQYNPQAAVWGNMSWAHATSPDMVHWTRQPIALLPTSGGPDAQGVFTGTAILRKGQLPTVLYTGIRTVPHDQATLSDGHNNFRETQCLAHATDDSLRTWQKLPAPVIPSPPPGMHVTGFRDPSPFELEGVWYTVIGSGIAGVGGNVLLYRATNSDLTQWEYLHPLLQGKGHPVPAGSSKDPVDSGEMWECPDFFPLDGGKHVLIYSTDRRTLWTSGVFDRKDLTFHLEKSGELDYGRGTFYAPKTQLDAHGNRILWGWLPETRPESEYARAGWSGVLSLPRRLYLNNGELHMEPAESLHLLRAYENRFPKAGGKSGNQSSTQPGGQSGKPPVLPSAPQEFRCVLNAANSGEPLPYRLYDAHGPLLEIRSDLAQDPRTIKVSGAPPEPRPASINNTHTASGSKLQTPLPTPDILIPLPERLPAQAGLHCIIDNSVLELFLDSRFPVTRRFYSRSPDEPILTLTLAGPCRISWPQSFSLKPIWPA